MKIDIDFYTLYVNKRILDFFFRQQSEDTLEELLNRARKETKFVLDNIDDYAFYNNLDADGIEEMFYNESVEWIAKEIGIELEEEEEEEEEE